MKSVDCEPIQFDETAMCYFAALCEGLRLINEKVKERPDLGEHFDANALVRFVQVKGQQIITLHHPDAPALMELVDIVAPVVVKLKRQNKCKCDRCGGLRSIGSAHWCRTCYLIKTQPL